MERSHKEFQLNYPPNALSVQFHLVDDGEKLFIENIYIHGNSGFNHGLPSNP